MQVLGLVEGQEGNRRDAPLTPKVWCVWEEQLRCRAQVPPMLCNPTSHVVCSCQRGGMRACTRLQDCNGRCL
jgi:hypothetical protein